MGVLIAVTPIPPCLLVLAPLPMRQGWEHGHPSSAEQLSIASVIILGHNHKGSNMGGGKFKGSLKMQLVHRIYLSTHAGVWIQPVVWMYPAPPRTLHSSLLSDEAR